MTRPSASIALCSALPIADAGEGAPEWVHLLPAGELRTVDGRGPYRVASLHSIAASLKDGEKLIIDECHSTDHAQRVGGSAPARGWIVALQAREDGLWGKVEWTGEGRRLMEDKAYRGLSPAVLHDKAKNVLGVLRASLTNTPNLKGLVALHSENSGMDWKAKLIELLGLDSDADDAAITSALSAKLKGDDADKPETALQSVLTHPTFVSLQSELTAAQEQIDAINTANARRDAESFVDAAIAEGRAGVKPARDQYIALHMSNPEQAQALIGAMPKIAGSSHAGTVAPATDANGLDAGDREVIALMGISEDDYKAAQARQGVKVEAL